MVMGMSAYLSDNGPLFSYTGDTSFNLAMATGGGSVVAFEMGPPVQLLRFNAL